MPRQKWLSQLKHGAVQSWELNSIYHDEIQVKHRSVWKISWFSKSSKKMKLKVAYQENNNNNQAVQTLSCWHERFQLGVFSSCKFAYITYSICRIPTLISLTVFDNFNLQEVLKTSQHQLQSPGEEPKWAAQVEQKDQCQGSHDDCRFHLHMSNEIPRSFRSELIDAKPGRRHHLPEWRQTHK